MQGDPGLGAWTYLKPTLSQVGLEIVEIDWVGGGGDEESDGGVGMGRGDLDWGGSGGRLARCFGLGGRLLVHGKGSKSKTRWGRLTRNIPTQGHNVP